MIISDHPLTQREFARKFSDNNREDFNPKFFERENKDIFDKIERVIKSCERDQYFSIKVISFREITSYSEVWETLYKHEEERRAMKRKPPKTDNPYQFYDLQDSDIMLLEVIYHIRINGEKPEDDNLKVIIMLPRFVDKYYFRLAGNYYAPVFQVVDRSTYNNTGNGGAKYPTITYRTEFMTIRIFRKNYNILCDYMSGQIIPSVNYDAYIFTKTVPAHKYLLAKYGFYGALNFLGLDNAVFLSTEPKIDDNLYCFKKEDIYISTPKLLFNQNHMVQSFVSTVFDAIPTLDHLNKKLKKSEELKSNAEAFEELFDPRYWVKELGSVYKDKELPINKGISVLNSLENVYDYNAKEILLLPEEKKETVYHILRWLLREFNIIKNKDNLDIGFKRIRISDACSALYAMKLSKGIYRISDEGKHVTMQMIKSAIYTQPNYILTVINSSKLINFADLVNDNDAITALSCTFKGISGLGEAGKVQTSYRRLHPSHIGRFDLDSSSAGDPGLTAVLAPYGKLYDNGFFSDIPEPDTWEEGYTQMVSEYNNLVGKREVISFKKKLGFEYDGIKDEILKETIKNYKQLICPVRDINGIIDYSQVPLD